MLKFLVIPYPVLRKGTFPFLSLLKEHTLVLHSDAQVEESGSQALGGSVTVLKVRELSGK